jgi:hypothetical protein
MLSLSVAAMATLWSLSRKVTERSRDTAEYFAIARQEAERDKAAAYYDTNTSTQISTFNALFIKNGVAAQRVTDYDHDGQPLAANRAYPNPPFSNGPTVVSTLTATSTATTGSYYRAVSTYTLVSTGSTAQAATDHRLGVQYIQIYANNGTTTVNTTASYQTTVFYSPPGG